jgi:tellurite resistance protein TerC
MTLLVWAAFIALFVAVLALDLGVLHRESKAMHVREALVWTVVWIVVALSFGGLVYGLYEYNWLGWTSGVLGEVRGRGQDIGGKEAFIQYVTGYLLEWSLSVDNIFVIAVIFNYMKIPAALQYRVLFWGIVGAIVLRGAMIAAGVALIHSFDWMFYVFGTILLLSAGRMLFSREAEYDPNHSLMVRATRRVFPITHELDGERFFTRVAGRHAATPLFVTLLLVDVADVVFAVDSIPAIFAVTQDPFLLLTSNAFAILGLRALYFAIAGMMAMFRYIKFALVVILGFIGVKMLLEQHVQISNLHSLAVIVGVLAVGVLASLWKNYHESLGE